MDDGEEDDNQVFPTIQILDDEDLDQNDYAFPQYEEEQLRFSKKKKKKRI